MSYTTTKAPGKTVLRSNFGSRPEVVRVFSYDAGRGTALVLFRSQFGDGDSHACVNLSDLEVIENQGGEHERYGSVSELVRKRAEHKVN